MLALSELNVFQMPSDTQAAGRALRVNTARPSHGSATDVTSISRSRKSVSLWSHNAVLSLLKLKTSVKCCSCYTSATRPTLRNFPAAPQDGQQPGLISRDGVAALSSQLMGTKQQATQTTIPEAAASLGGVCVCVCGGGYLFGFRGSQTPHVSSDIISSG